MRLGRILSGRNRIRIYNEYILLYISSGGAKGPGLFFVLPCVDSIMKVDLRTSLPLFYHSLFIHSFFF